MLNINPEIVCAIIQKCHEFHAKEGVVFPQTDNNEDSDWAMQVLANHADDPTYRELRYAIDDLDSEHQIELVALMWLGRGDFTLDQWDEALNESKERLTSRTAEYLIGTPLVADYLEEGLAVHGYSCNP
jgi:hypothetical protein